MAVILMTRTQVNAFCMEIANKIDQLIEGQIEDAAVQALGGAGILLFVITANLEHVKDLHELTTRWNRQREHVTNAGTDGPPSTT